MSTSMFKKMSGLAVAAALAIAGLSSTAHAANPPFKTGFETTPDMQGNTYTAGALNTQNGWGKAQFSDALTGGAAGTLLVSGSAGTLSAQGVSMTTNGSQNYIDYFSSQTTYAPTLPASFNNVVSINVDLRRNAPAGGAGNPRSAFGIDIMSSGINSGTAGDHVLASLFIGNASDNSKAMIVTNGTDAATTYAGLAPFGDDGSWGTYHIRLDFNNNTFTVFADGNPTAAGPFALNAAAVAEGGIGGIAFASDNFASGDTAFFDNLSVVPEPAGFAMVGLGSLLLLAKRPKRLA